MKSCIDEKNEMQQGKPPYTLGYKVSQSFAPLSKKRRGGPAAVYFVVVM